MRERPLPLLLFLLVAAVLIFLWRSGGSADSADREWQSEMDVSSSSASKSGRRFAFVCMSTKETSYDHIGFGNKFQYAQKHGYDFRFDFDGHWDGWDKYNKISDAIEADKYDWIFFLDFDTIITNTSITLDSIVDDALADVKNPDDIDMILTPDCWPLNIGAMLMRSTPWVLDILDKTRECGNLEAEPGRHYSDQDCLNKMLEDNVLDAKKKSTIIRQWKMNAFPTEIGCYDDGETHWEKGMFVIHFAGAWAHVHTDDPTGDLMRKYAPYIDAE